MKDGTLLRLATMAFATTMVVAGAITASSVARNSERNRWWTSLVGFVVAAGVVYAGFTLFRSGYYFAYDPS